MHYAALVYRMNDKFSPSDKQNNIQQNSSKKLYISMPLVSYLERGLWREVDLFDLLQSAEQGTNAMW